MYQKSQVLPPHLQKMIFEMELRGYAQHTKDHYLGHIKLLEKHTNKSVAEITPDELKQYLHDRIQSGIGYRVSIYHAARSNSFSIKFSVTTGPTTLLSVPKSLNHFRMFFLKTRFCPSLIRYGI